MKTLITLPQVAVLMLTLSMALAGCQKKREAKLGDGEGRYSEPVSTYDGKVFKLTTLNEIGKGGVISSSETYKVEANTKDGTLVTYPAVDYKTDAKIISDVLILAKPNTSNVYEIHYKLTNTHLVVSKVAPEAYIPYQEKTYAEKLSDGRLSVPLFGYPIVAKLVREKVKNDLGETTSRLTERMVTDISQAQFVQIDFTRGDAFEAVKKVDTFPVSFFTGEKQDTEWYYATTILNTPDNAVDGIGWSDNMSFMGLNDSVVKFRRTQSGLEAVSLSLDDRGRGNESNFKKVVFIPGEYKEFKVEKDGRFRKMREQEEASDELPWNKTKYIKLDFARTAAPLLNSAGRGENEPLNEIDVNGMKLVELYVRDNYVSIILENMKTNSRVQIAFLKKEAKTNYKPLVYHSDDNEIFGFMNTTTPFFKDYRVRREEDYKKMYKVSRFQPNENNEIVYHLSKSTPDWLIPSAQKAVDAWDKVFQQHTGIRIRLNTDRVNTGDIRYNVLNFIDTKMTNMGLGGFGPTVTDPETGRIVSATSTMHVHTYRQILVSTIRAYVLGKTGAIPDFYANPKVELSQMLSGTAKRIENAISKHFGEKLKNKESVASVVSKPTAEGLRETEKSKVTWKDKLEFLLSNERSTYKALNELKNNSFANPIASAPRQETPVMTVPDNVEETIKGYCPELYDYIANLKSQGKKYDENEVTNIEDCANKVLVDAIVSTVVHEMGHNFGLRHNFAGSADYNNFPKDEKQQPTAFSSSIMDYVPMSFDRLTNPGPYDIAAIKYAYAGVVELKDGSVKPLDHTKSIKENLNGRLDLLKPYKFCDDTDAYGFQNDPMCQLHDIGWTPELAVRNEIKQANEYFVSALYKHDRAKSADANGVAYSMMHSAQSLMKYYNFWRVKLAEFMNKQRVHLDGLSKQDYAAILKKMESDPSYGPIYRAYKAPIKGTNGQPDRPSVVDQIYRFFTSYVFLPNRYCLLQSSKDQSLSIEEFDKIRHEVYANERVSISSCKQQEVANYLNKKNLTVVTEFGYSATDVRYDLTDNSEYNALLGFQPYDAISTLPTRSLMAAYATLRVTQSLRSYEIGLLPSFMDEPEYREDWLTRIFDRVLEGVNPKLIVQSLPYLRTELEQKNLLTRFQATKHAFKYKIEKNLLDEALMYTQFGFNIPNDREASLERLEPIFGTIAQPGSGGTDLGIGVEYIPGGIYAKNIAKKFTSNRLARSMNEETAKALGAAVAQLKFPETQEELNKMTAGELYTKFETFNSMLQEATQGNESMLKIYKDLFATIFPELEALAEDAEAFRATVTQKLQQTPEFGEAQKQAQEAQSEQNEEKMKKAQEKINELQKPYLQASITTLVKKFKPFKVVDKVNEALKRAEDIRQNSEEHSSQQHLFLMFMIR